MQDVMTKDAAKALGVSQRQVVELLRAGKLRGEQLPDGTWLVSRNSIGQRNTLHAGQGRAWSSESSWALLGELSGRTFEGLSQSTRDRIKRRIRVSSAEDIARKVSTRTVAHRFVADSLSKTAADLVLTGSSAVSVIDRNLTSQTRQVEGYLREGTLVDFAKRHLLTAQADGDVTIYDSPSVGYFDGLYATQAVVAADLSRSLVTRERSAGLAALENLRLAWLGKHTR